MKRFFKFLAMIMTSLQLGSTLLSTDVFAKVRVNVNKNTTPIRVLAYGDSLTAGFRLAPQDSYPAQLQARMRKRGYSIDFVNGGVSGDTSAQALARLKWSLNSGPFDYALLCIGANDGLRQLSLEDFENNLAAIVDQMQANRIKVILLGMQIPTNFPPEYRATFKRIFERTAKKYSLPLYPFLLEGVAQIAGLNLEDGIHPNRAGYAIIAEKLQKFIEPIISK